MAEHVFYEITKAAVEGRDSLGAVIVLTRALTPALMAQDVGVPLHPGAKGYDRETRREAWLGRARPPGGPGSPPSLGMIETTVRPPDKAGVSGSVVKPLAAAAIAAIADQCLAPQRLAL